MKKEGSPPKHRNFPLHRRGFPLAGRLGMGSFARANTNAIPKIVSTDILFEASLLYNPATKNITYLYIGFHA